MVVVLKIRIKQAHFEFHTEPGQPCPLTRCYAEQMTCKLKMNSPDFLILFTG